MSVAARSGLEPLRARFEQHAVVHRRRSPLYAKICRAVAGDDEALALMHSAPQAQRRPTLLLAAIHDLLLAGTEHELAAHVPTVAAGRAHVAAPGSRARGAGCWPACGPTRPTAWRACGR